MSLFNYPVKITADDLLTWKGIDLVKEYGQAGVNIFLSEVHSSIYESCIYATGDKDIKNRIINKFSEKTETAIKQALLIQAAYINDQGNVGMESGITISADGQKAVIGKRELRDKIICPAALDVLKACEIPILYAGEKI